MNFLSVRGRTSLGGFWLSMPVLAVLFAIFAGAAYYFIPIWFSDYLPLELPPRQATILMGTIAAGAIPLVIPTVLLLIRRLHDRGRSGLLIIPPIFAKLTLLGYAAPLLVEGARDLTSLLAAGVSAAILLWFFIEVALLPGTAGDNAYGPRP